MITRFKKIVRSTIVVLADRSCSLFNFGEIRDFAIFFLDHALCIELKAPFLFKSQRVSDLHLLFRSNLIWNFQKTSNNFKYVNRSVTHALSFSVSRYTILGILRWVEVDMLMPPCEDNEVLRDYAQEHGWTACNFGCSFFPTEPEHRITFQVKLSGVGTQECRLRVVDH